MNTLSLASSRAQYSRFGAVGAVEREPQVCAGGCRPGVGDRVAHPRRQVEGRLVDAPHAGRLDAELLAQEAGLQATDHVPGRRLVLEQFTVVQRADDRLQERAVVGFPGILVEQHQPVDHPAGGEQLLPGRSRTGGPPAARSGSPGS